MSVPLTNTTQNSLPSLTQQLVRNGYMDPVWYRFFYAFLGQLLSTNVLINANNLSDVSDSLTSFNNISPLLVAGDMLYFDGTNNTRLASSIDATRYIANTGTLNEPQWDTVNLANGVSGNLAVSHLNSGTNAGTTTFWCGNGQWITTGQGLNGTQSFTANGTFNIPAGVSKMLIKAWGAGGGGGNGTGQATPIARAGGGGGGGGYLESVISIPNGTTTLSITIGTAGTGGNPGSNGTSTIVSGTGISTLTAGGGFGGTASSTGADGVGGAGGTCINGTLSITGQAGVTPTFSSTTLNSVIPISMGGGTFGSASQWIYSNAGTSIVPTLPGIGGASGAGIAQSSGGGVAGNGSGGLVQIIW